MASHVQLFDGRPVVSSIPGRPAVCQLPLGSNAVASAPAVTEEQEEEEDAGQSRR